MMSLSAVDSFRSQTSCTSNESEFSKFEKRSNTSGMSSRTSPVTTSQGANYLSRRHLESQLFGDDCEVFNETQDKIAGQLTGSNWSESLILTEQNLAEQFNGSCKVSQDPYKVELDLNIFACASPGQVYGSQRDFPTPQKSPIPQLPFSGGFPPRPTARYASGFVPQQQQRGPYSAHNTPPLSPHISPHLTPNLTPRSLTPPHSHMYGGAAGGGGGGGHMQNTASFNAHQHVPYGGYSPPPMNSLNMNNNNINGGHNQQLNHHNNHMNSGPYSRQSTPPIHHSSQNSPRQQTAPQHQQQQSPSYSNFSTPSPSTKISLTDDSPSSETETAPGTGTLKDPHSFYFPGHHFTQKGFIPYPKVREPPPVIYPSTPEQDNRLIYMVTFKTTSKDFMLGPRAPLNVAIGDAVIVAVDKGEDLGVVTRILTMEQFTMERFQAAYIPQAFNISKYVGNIIKLASVRERRKMRVKVDEEREVLEYARHLAKNVYHIQITVHDVEFQYDRYKITVYYTAQGRVDYRDFSNDIFHTFKARVWMERV